MTRIILHQWCICCNCHSASWMVLDVPYQEAIRMHESISPERWCVTYRDLRYLWQEVAEAIRQGSPKPLMWRCDALGSLTLDKYKKNVFQHAEAVTENMLCFYGTKVICFLGDSSCTNVVFFVSQFTGFCRDRRNCAR